MPPKHLGNTQPPTLAQTGGNPTSPPHHAPFGRQKYREVKKWGTKQSEDGWTCKLLGLNWNEHGVEETWEWTPPPPQGVATKDNGEEGTGKPLKRTRKKGTTATKKDSKKGKQARKAGKKDSKKGKKDSKKGKGRSP